VRANLSTFSAHVKNLAEILAETGPGALVLLDELATGTDPREGEALAAGVLDSLSARGGATVATTHYEGLKALAFADDRFVNASVGFDLALMTPTFRLATGIPGSSSALAVARRFGMPSTVIERAERFLTREELGFEAMVKKLNEERAALDLARQAADAREAEAREARARFERELESAKNREKRATSEEAEALLASVRRAREDLRAAQARLRAKKLDEAGVREAERALDRVASQVAMGGELEHLVVRQESASARERVGATELKKGQRVYVPRLRAEAEILDVDGDSVRVAAGPLKLMVAVHELRAAATPTRERPHRAAPVRTARIFESPIPTDDNSCDLRGLRVDEAVAMAATFLDRSLNEGRGIAFLIHGHGTGALREAIRRDLQASTIVARFRAGEPSEGGDGVTVVWLVD
jgi:DNA mismatch repair protein MutS2